MSEIETIHGVRKESDKNLIQKIDLTELDVNRINAVDNAFAYIEMNAHEKATAFTPAMMVACFAIGAGLIGTLWIMSTYLPLVDKLPF